MRRAGDSHAHFGISLYLENVFCSCRTFLGRLWDSFAAQKPTYPVVLGDGAVGLTLMGILALIKPLIRAAPQTDSPRVGWQFSTCCTTMDTHAPQGAASRLWDSFLINLEAAAKKQYFYSSQPRREVKQRPGSWRNFFSKEQGLSGVGAAQLHVKGRRALRLQH